MTARDMLMMLTGSLSMAVISVIWNMRRTRNFYYQEREKLEYDVREYLQKLMRGEHDF